MDYKLKYLKYKKKYLQEQKGSGYICNPDEKLLKNFCKHVKDRGDYPTIDKCLNNCMDKKRVLNNIPFNKELLYTLPDIPPYRLLNNPDIPSDNPDIPSDSNRVLDKPDKPLDISLDDNDTPLNYEEFQNIIKDMDCEKIINLRLVNKQFRDYIDANSDDIYFMLKKKNPYFPRIKEFDDGYRDDLTPYDKRRLFVNNCNWYILLNKLKKTIPNYFELVYQENYTKTQIETIIILVEAGFRQDYVVERVKLGNFTERQIEAMIILKKEGFDNDLLYLPKLNKSQIDLMLTYKKKYYYYFNNYDISYIVLNNFTERQIEIMLILRKEDFDSKDYLWAALKNFTERQIEIMLILRKEGFNSNEYFRAAQENFTETQIDMLVIAKKAGVDYHDIYMTAVSNHSLKTFMYKIKENISDKEILNKLKQLYKQKLKEKYN